MVLGNAHAAPAAQADAIQLLQCPKAALLPEAQLLLAEYLLRRNVDDAEGASWLQKAVDQGHPAVADIFEEAKHEADREYWFVNLKAAEGGHVGAMMRMEYAYRE